MRAAEKVAFAWIDPGQVDGAFAHSLTELVRDRGDRISAFIRVEGGLISRQRNQVVATFLDRDDSDWLLMVDSDEVLTVPVLDLLVKTAHAVERPVVAGMVFTASSSAGDDGLAPSPMPCIFKTTNQGVRVTPFMDYPPFSVVEVDAAGTGCLMVHRSVFERIREHADDLGGPDWCWFRDMPMYGDWFGEDLYFCRLVRSLGIPIHAHTGAVLPHRRSYWLDHRQHEAARAIAEEVARRGSADIGSGQDRGRIDGDAEYA